MYNNFLSVFIKRKKLTHYNPVFLRVTKTSLPAYLQVKSCGLQRHRGSPIVLANQPKGAVSKEETAPLAFIHVNTY
jgi:hypothetical protein